MIAGGLFVAMVAAFAGGSVVPLVIRGRRAARVATGAAAAAGSTAALGLAAIVLGRGASFDLAVPGLLALAGGLRLHLDALGAFFLGLVAVVSLPAALYGAAYTASFDRTGTARFLGSAFNVFLLAMCLVPCAANVITFLIAWELMSLASYFLVMTDAEQPDARDAGLWYLSMTQFGFVALLPMFLLLAPAPDRLAFSDLRAGAAALGPGARGFVFVLAIVGFGSKAGVVPLHVWLPRAHPAAPSHVSALMSGVMIKLGVYGLLRVVFDVMGGGPPWWGGVLLVVGSVSALLGVLYALMQHDLKRLLAYHSVENIGIILIGLGAGSMLRSYGLDALAAIGFAAALFHTLNHACFKSLLFLASGNVLHEARTRNMEEMGGLIKRMPQTAALFLVGAAAIAALPPLNGFASEWMVFQALLGGTRVPRPEVAIAFPVAVGMLALASGLAAACFVKAFGISFLAMPRSTEAAEAHEAPLLMRWPAWILASACVGLGVGASYVVPTLYRVLEESRLVPEAVVVHAWSASIEAPQAVGQVAPAAIAALLIVVVLLTVGVVRMIHRRPVRRADTWGCGRIVQTARMEYTASAFAEPLRRVFAELYRPTRDLTVSAHPDSPYYVKAMTFTSEVHPWFEQVLYDPFVRLMRGVSARVRRLQAGSVHLYLVYVTVALFAALTSVWWLR